MTAKSDIEKAYLAGFIDGEGSIGFDTFGGKRAPTICVSVTNTNIDVLKALANEWGGNLYLRNPSSKRPAHWKATADVKWSAQKAHRILREIIPFLRIKKEQADLAIEFFKTVNPPEHRSRRVSLTDEVKRVAIFNELRRLNRRPKPAEKTAAMAPTS